MPFISMRDVKEILLEEEDGRKEKNYIAIIVVKEAILQGIVLKLDVGNVERKDMKKKVASLNFLECLQIGIKE
jgi:hypothetical protein